MNDYQITDYFPSDEDYAAEQGAKMNKTELKKDLSRMADDLLDIADAIQDDDEAARMARKASYLVEDLKTSQAVGELVAAAARQSGASGTVEVAILRPRRSVTV